MGAVTATRRMMRRLVQGMTLTLILSGCAMPVTTKTRHIESAFDLAVTSAQMQPGTHSINGSALMRQRGGGVVTCAGEDVVLFPVTPYSVERIEWLFGIRGPRASIQLWRPITFDPDPVEFHQLMKRSTCDAQGAFVFTKLRPGRYYLTTRIAWTVADIRQGAQLMQMISISADLDEPLRVVLTD